MNKYRQKWYSLIGKIATVESEKKETQKKKKEKTTTDEKKCDVCANNDSCTIIISKVDEIIKKLQPESEKSHMSILKKKTDLRVPGNQRAILVCSFFILLALFTTYMRINNQTTYWAPVVGTVVTFFTGNPDAGLFD